MSDRANIGSKLRAIRRRRGLTQAQVAERLGISPSYFNLLENNRRPLPADLLIQLARHLEVDLDAFAPHEEGRLSADLMEAFGDPLFDPHDLTPDEVREFAAASPRVARAVLGLYHAFQAGRRATDDLALRLSDDLEKDEPARSLPPSEEVSDLIQKHLNYFPDLEEGAERLRRVARLDDDDLARGLRRHLETRHGIEVRVETARAMGRAVRRFDPGHKLLALSEILRPRSRSFQLAHQIGLLEHSAVLDRIAADPLLTAPDSRSLARVALANYFAGAVLMPYEPFLEAARSERYDIEILGHRFRTSFEQICHRLTTLRRPGAEGIPIHMIRVDVAGNISKRFSASGLRIPRFSGACPRWGVHASFLTPGMIHVQLSRLSDGTTFFTVSRALRHTGGGYHQLQAMHAVSIGCEVHHAREMVYADGVAIENAEIPVPVGVTCRICERMDCDQRAFPPLQHPLTVDENVRGVSFYAPAESD